MKTAITLLCAMSVCSVSARTIVCPASASAHVKLAAKEIRRYVYLRTGELLPISESGKGIVLKVDSALDSQQYRLQSDGKRLAIAGGSDLAVLYGAYAFAEKLGVRFYLHGDVIPDEKIPFAWPTFDETRKPLFEMRGINPWATHVYGFELWEAEGFKSVISQMVKMRMNLIGMHNYSEAGWGSEPTVWIGLPEDVKGNGDPKFSYSSFYVNTERNVGGGQKPRRTGDYGYGGHLLFETDKWGVSVMNGHFPHGKTVEEKNEVFIRTGHLLREAFEHAHRLGIKTALGTEMPLTDPTRLLPHELRAHMKEQGKSIHDPEVLREVYRGTFLRAMKAYPLDYYWLWTPETWRRPQKQAVVNAARDDLLAAVEAAKEVNAPFTLATAGWVLGPAVDRTMFDHILPKEMPFAALNRELGTVPVEPGFAALKGRPGWAIPWLEDDLSSNSPQLWVGRILRDAYDAQRYGCNGLMGLHWRTDEVGPMVGALMQAQWQVPAVPTDADDAPIRVQGGGVAHFAAPQKNTILDPVYQSVRYDMSGYEFKVPNGSYKVTLQFNEPYFNAAKQRVFGVVVQGETVIEELDVFARVGKNCALDFTFENVVVNNGTLAVEFLSDISEGLMEGDRKAQKIKYVSLPCIAGIVLEGPRTLKLNCGGSAWGGYIADPGRRGLPRYLPTEDFYCDWALHQFGPAVSDKIAAWFSRMDGHLPTPAPGCPGQIRPNGRPWSQVEADYAFVDELESLRSRVVGKGNRARFDHWVTSFEYLRAIGEVSCRVGEMRQAMGALARQTEPQAKRAYAREKVLPVRIQLNNAWARMVTLALEAAESWGGIGNVMGHETANRHLLDDSVPALEKALGEPLPPAAQCWQDYRGQPRLIVLTPQGIRTATESMHMRVLVLDNARPRSATLRWRTLGTGPWHDAPVKHVARAVHSVTLPAAGDETVEFYIEVATVGGEILHWPVTAPQLNQTVVVTGKTAEGELK